MGRVTVALMVLTVVAGGLVGIEPTPLVTAAQEGTPAAERRMTAADRKPVADHELVGSWLIFETNPPAGGDPVLAGVGTFFDDGNVILSFGDQRYQGSWLGNEPYEATFTVVAPSAGGIGELDQLRGSLEVATDGGPFRGIYTFDLISADGSATFTYRGPIEGRRVEVQAPEPYP